MCVDQISDDEDVAASRTAKNHRGSSPDPHLAASLLRDQAPAVLFDGQVKRARPCRTPAVTAPAVYPERGLNGGLLRTSAVINVQKLSAITGQ
jgi:hypothetical protein